MIITPGTKLYIQSLFFNNPGERLDGYMYYVSGNKTNRYIPLGESLYFRSGDTKLHPEMPDWFPSKELAIEAVKKVCHLCTVHDMTHVRESNAVSYEEIQKYCEDWKVLHAEDRSGKMYGIVQSVLDMAANYHHVCLMIQECDRLMYQANQIINANERPERSL